MPEQKDGCVKPAHGPILPMHKPSDLPVSTETHKEADNMLARVGNESIDFEANAFIASEGFKPVKLSDYKGKWIVLCFYPGDFTFV